MRKHLLAAALLVSLSACGSDVGSPPPPTPPIPPSGNRAPTFTSATTASIVENVAEAYQATTSDPDNDPVTVAISGGADAALFTLDITGKLSFRTPPNFDEPGDADGDNVYEVTLSASDGQATTSQAIRITVTNSREGIAVRRIATGFVQPVQVFPVLGSPGQLYVIEKTGGVYQLDISNGERTHLFTVSDISTDGERGLLGITRGPIGILKNSWALYVVATGLDGSVQLRQYTPTNFGTFVQPVSTTLLLSIPHAAHSNHNGGWVDFGPDGKLYLGVGDGGGVGDPDNNAQNPHVMLGKILRLGATQDPYAGASAQFWEAARDNPYAGGGGNPYVFALGLRNPFRASFDGQMLLIGDVGQDAREEVNLITTASGGANLGWVFREGTQTYRGSPPPGLTDPVLQYGHGNGPLQGASIIGGRVYRGPIASLNGHYLFADFVSGHIWSVPLSRLVPGQTLDQRGFERRDADFTPDQGRIDKPVAFGVDQAKNHFIVDFDGEIFQIVSDPTSP